MPRSAPEERDRSQDAAAERTSIGADVVHEAIRREGEQELQRPSSALAWSGLAAGLSMGFSLAAEAVLYAALPDAPWRPLVAKLGYTVGFLIVVLGRQQLFTENTLTPMLPLLSRPSLAVGGNVARLWAIVLATNLIGTLAFAWLVGTTEVFEPPVRAAFGALAADEARGGWATIFIQAVFGGWLIALMVWLLPFAEAGRIWVVLIITYVVGIGGFAHIIAGATAVFYAAVTGATTWGAALGHYMAPTLLGNIVGGVSLVAALNHAQVHAGGKAGTARAPSAGGRVA
jgi:formate-nitrite transporter family protein